MNNKADCAHCFIWMETFDFTEKGLSAFTNIITIRKLFTGFDLHRWGAKNSCNTGDYSFCTARRQLPRHYEPTSKQHYREWMHNWHAVWTSGVSAASFIWSHTGGLDFRGWGRAGRNGGCSNSQQGSQLSHLAYHLCNSSSWTQYYYYYSYNPLFYLIFLLLYWAR